MSGERTAASAARHTWITHSIQSYESVCPGREDQMRDGDYIYDGKQWPWLGNRKWQRIH